MKKTILITGASSGIGRACALKGAQEGHRILICARREEKLQELVKEIEQTYHADVYAFPIDVSKQSAVEKAIASLPDEWKTIDVLVNNAGLALGLEGVDRGDPQDWETMVQVNILGLLYMTKAVSIGMLERNRGHIINIGSISGREVYPGGSVYCSTKHAVRALTEGMKKDWHGTKIRMSEVNPGFAETEFSIVRFKGDQKRADAVYQNTKALQAEDVADAIFYCINCPEHVDIREIFITATVQSSSTMIDRSN